MGNKRSFHYAEPSKGHSENTWYTPSNLMRDLGTFDLDPCTNSTRPFDSAITCVEYDRGGDGLSIAWDGLVFCNPPYGKETGKWLKKLKEHGSGVALVFSRCETKWAQEALKNCDAVNFIKGRISFIRKDGTKGTSAACGSMLLAYGDEAVSRVSAIKGVLFLNNDKKTVGGKP